MFEVYEKLVLFVRKGLKFETNLDNSEKLERASEPSLFVFFFLLDLQAYKWWNSPSSTLKLAFFLFLKI